MRRMVIALALLGICASSGVIGASEIPSPAEREQFKTLAYKLWTAWDTLNPANVAAFYSKDPNNVYFDISPLKFKGWGEYAKVAGNSLVGATAKWSPNGDDFNLIKSGDLAVTTLTMNLLFTGKDGKSGTMQVRATDVWQKEGSKWLVVHEHVSVPSR